MTMTAYDVACAALVELCTDLETLMRDQLIGLALLKYRRGFAIATHCSAYSGYGEDGIGRLAGLIGLHPTTLREEVRVARLYPQEAAFLELLKTAKTWHRVTQQLPQVRNRTKPEIAEQVDSDCYGLENAGRLVERILSNPPEDVTIRKEIAATLTVLAVDAAQAALTFDPDLEVNPPGLTSDAVVWSGVFAEAFDDSPLSKTDVAMFKVWLDVRGGVLEDDYAKTYRALMRVMENPREPMGRGKGR